MGELRFLQIEIDGRVYLCPENCIDKVLQIKTEDTFLSPFGPEHLKCVLNYKEEVIPLFGSKGFSSGAESSVVVIIKKLLGLAGLMVDKVKSFITVDEGVLADSVEAPVFLSRKAVRHQGSDYYFLNIDALFEGKE